MGESRNTQGSRRRRRVGGGRGRLLHSAPFSFLLLTVTRECITKLDNRRFLLLNKQRKQNGKGDNQNKEREQDQ